MEALKKRILNQNLFFLQKDEYNDLHKDFLTPLDIYIDCNLFQSEIDKFHDSFQKWGNRYPNLPRFSVPLVNSNGRLDNVQDPSLGSLSHWNEDNPDNPLIENDFSTPTSVMNIKSLQPLKIFETYLTRSNILKWYKDAEFKPHIDTQVPTPYLRLWGTTDPTTIELSYFSGDSFNVVKNIEKGRLYLIDTSIVHIAKATGFNYQFFISVNSEAWKLIKTHLVAAK